MTIWRWDRSWGKRKDRELSHSARLVSHEIGDPREEVSVPKKCCSWLQAHRERAIGCRITVESIHGDEAVKTLAVCVIPK